MVTLICARCEKEILPISNRARVYILQGGKCYHVECVTSNGPVLCYECGKVIHPGDSNRTASHGICPWCIRAQYPDYADEVLDDGFEAAADCVSGNGVLN